MSFNRTEARSLRLAVSALALIAAGAPLSAFAQTADPQQGNGATQAQDASAPAITDQSDQSTASDVVVTGSRIVRAEVTAQPVAVLSADQIGKVGYTNLGSALQELPSFGIPGNSPIGAQGSFSAGQTYVDLYNMGSQRTLSLVNGNRFVSSASSSIFGPVAGSPVDFASIPTDLVDRTEVVSVGGAPIYGSDAIAGTVNVILKKNFEGLQASAQMGVSQKGDGQDYTLSLLAGHNFAGGRGNITANVMYDHQDGIPTSDRFTLGGNGPFFGTSLDGDSFAERLFYGGEHYGVFTNTGMPLFADDIPQYGGLTGGPNGSGIVNGAGQLLYFNPSGKLVPFQNGQQTGNGLVEAGGDGFPIGDFANFLTNSQRIQGTLLAHYDFSDHFRFSGEAWVGRDKAANLRDQPYYNTALFAGAGEVNGNLILSTDNPYLSAADRQTIINNLVANGQDPSTFYLTRANTDLETGSFQSTSDLYRFVGTFSGDFSLGSHGFNWEVTGNYGHNETKTTQRELVTQNYYNALNATTDASGNIICTPGYTNAAIATLSNTCAPLDIFGVNQASLAALNYITSIAQTDQVNTQLDIVADIGGTVFKLPGGDVKFSLGYEHRRESTDFDPGAFYFGQDNGDGTRTQYGNSIPIDPVAGSYHTNELFGELDIPVVSPEMNVPFIHSLNLTGSGRYVKNSLTNTGFWAYTGGGTYSPVRDITFRGNYTRSFRGPAITEAFAPTGTVFDTADDPCDPRFRSGGPDPTRRDANCSAAGVPAQVPDPANPGKLKDFVSNVADFTAQGTFGGNSNLQNEIANSWTAGAVIEPRFIPGFKLSADYVAIDISNEIASLSLTDLMDACYDGSTFPNSYCGSFTRDANNQVTSFAEGNYNIGIEHFRALQATLDYTLPLSRLGLPESAGTLGLSVNYLHTFSHYTKVGEGDQQLSVGTTQEPSDNFTANLNYDNGGFNFLWQTMYYGPTKIDVNQPDSTYQYPNIGQYFMFNSSIGYDITKQFQIRLIINNIFDKGVPFPYSVSQTRYYDALMGRYFKMSIGVKF